jgi:hypothetical protein
VLEVTGPFFAYLDHRHTVSEACEFHRPEIHSEAITDRDRVSLKAHLAASSCVKHVLHFGEVGQY